jgi:hypothetical protein
MKQSRLQSRKLGIKPLKKTKKSHTKFLLILAALCLTILSIIYLILNASSSWDGKSKFTIASENLTGDITIQILDPSNSSITKIIIPATTEVDAANELGKWKLGSIVKLGIDKNKGNDFLKNTLIKSFQFPIDGSSNLPLLDKMRIKFFLLTLAGGNELNLNLEETDYLNRAKLKDGTLGWKIAESMPTNVESYFNENSQNGRGVNVAVNNSSGVRGEGIMAGKVIEVLGLNVASIINSDKNDFDCKVISENKDLAIKISKILSCDIKFAKPQNNFDLEINLGSKFAQRF